MNKDLLQSQSNSPNIRLDLITSLNTTIKNIFDLDNDNEYNDSLKLCFKALIFDDDSYTVLSPMLKVYSLREHNICLYMNIKDNTDRVQDVMAIYIIRPTKANYDLILNDINRNVFDNYYINIIDYNTSTGTGNANGALTELYELIANSPNYNSIYKIIISPIDFCVYHPHIFSLNINKPFLLLNSPNVSEDKTNEYFNAVSNGLFSVLFTLKQIPIVKYRSKSYPAEEVIKRVQEKFTNAFDSNPDLKEDFPKQRPSLVIVLDRETDIPIMLHHSTCFGAMINDISGINRGTPKDKSNIGSFELDPINDYIWNDNVNEPFDQVASIILKDYKKHYESMSYLDRISKPKGIDEIKDDNEKLSASIESLRDNQIINNILKQHKMVYDAIDKEQQRRMYGLMNEHEALILAKRRSMTLEAKASLLKLIRSYDVNDDNANGSIDENKADDLYRMIIIYYLSNQSLTPNEEGELESIIKDKCNQTNQLFKYIKGKNSKKASVYGTGSNAGSNASFFQSGINYVINSIGSLLTIEQPSILADLINLLVMNKDIKGFSTYNFNTRSIEGNNSINTSLSLNMEYKEVIIFTIGGGCLGEYEYINGILKQSGRNVIYGCDQLYSPKEFLNDLITLSK